MADPRFPARLHVLLAPRARRCDILYADAGCLYRAAMGRGGPGEPTLLRDFTPMTFEAIAAPY